jgi:glycosyltransferase involved in cell wall biosynthesis
MGDGMSEEEGVCVITQPQRSRIAKDHAHDLADIVAQITTVTVLTANLPEDAPMRDDHDIVEFSSAGTGERVLVEAVRFVLNQLRLCRVIARREEHTMLFFGTTSYLLPVICSRLLGKRVLVLPRGDVPLSLRLRWEQQLPASLARVLAGLVSALERVSYRLADDVVSYTPAMADQLGLDRYGDKLSTNGARFVDTQQFDIQRSFEERERAVGFIGRLDVEKRVPELAAAAKRLPDDITFVFVGDGTYREHLEEKLAAEIDAGTVDVVGWVDREAVPEQLNRLRLQVVPSHPTEGLPTAILEGMACGTPAYATPVSGVPDVVRADETGFLMEDEHGPAIAAEIEQILERDDLAEMSQACRKMIIAEYSFEGAVERWQQILAPSKT